MYRVLSNFTTVSTYEIAENFFASHRDLCPTRSRNMRELVLQAAGIQSTTYVHSRELDFRLRQRLPLFRRAWKNMSVRGRRGNGECADPWYGVVRLRRIKREREREREGKERAILLTIWPGGSPAARPVDSTNLSCLARLRSTRPHHTVAANTTLVAALEKLSLAKSKLFPPGRAFPSLPLSPSKTEKRIRGKYGFLRTSA